MELADLYNKVRSQVFTDGKGSRRASAGRRKAAYRVRTSVCQDPRITVIQMVWSGYCTSRSSLDVVPTQLISHKQHGSSHPLSGIMSFLCLHGGGIS